MRLKFWKKKKEIISEGVIEDVCTHENTAIAIELDVWEEALILLTESELVSDIVIIGKSCIYYKIIRTGEFEVFYPALVKYTKKACLDCKTCLGWYSSVYGVNYYQTDQSSLDWSYSGYVDDFLKKIEGSASDALKNELFGHVYEKIEAMEICGVL